MMIYFTPQNHQLPLCHACKEALDQHGILDNVGHYWHPECLGNVLELVGIKINAIITSTQGTNAQANSLARGIRSMLYDH